MIIGYTKDWIRLSSPSPSWLSQIHLPNHDEVLVSLGFYVAIYITSHKMHSFVGVDKFYIMMDMWFINIVLVTLLAPCNSHV